MEFHSNYFHGRSIGSFGLDNVLFIRQSCLRHRENENTRALLSRFLALNAIHANDRWRKFYSFRCFELEQHFHFPSKRFGTCLQLKGALVACRR